MITKLGLRNFKSISESGIEIDLKPLTVLMGPNASGKSSILEAIGIFAESIGGPLDSTGDLVVHRDFTDVIHKRETNRWLTIEIHIDALGYRYSFKKLLVLPFSVVAIGSLRVCGVAGTSLCLCVSAPLR
ncbi:MAG: AAA family ATPase [Euryarchaeota archaeon]|nr:AAA family ATPase [Euryarchaeota archaeon]